MSLIGNIFNKIVIIIDDIIDTAGIPRRATDVLIESGKGTHIRSNSYSFIWVSHWFYWESSISEITFIDSIALSNSTRKNNKIRIFYSRHLSAIRLMNLNFDLKFKLKI